MGVRDMCFTNDGKHFLTSSFDRFTKLWDTETGQCVQRFTTNKVPFCCVYNPAEDKQDFFLTGMQDKKIIQWDVRSGEQTQEYDRHLGPVNTITFFDENRRFASTSDDKSVRIWEWEVPVDTKVISAPDLHAIPAVKMSPDGKWLVGQSMDNRIIVFQVADSKLRFAKKRAFKGHMNSGYACAMDYSPDMSYMISGDSAGKVFVWNFKTNGMVARWKAHDQVCIGSLWHPHEPSKVVTCGWDNVIKMWD
jgi:pre-mRNA-processing factor 17